MRMDTHEVWNDRVPSLLLFVRATDDLARTCRQAGEFIGFCRQRQSGSFADGRLLGAWIDEQTVTELPQEMALRLPSREVVTVTLRETFSLYGVWAVASIEFSSLGTRGNVELSHNGVFDALSTVAPGHAESGSRYSPAFACDTPEKQVRAAIRRLDSRYPLRIAQPIYYDPVTGGLSLRNRE